MNKLLKPDDLDSIRAIVEFAKPFAIDILRVSSSNGIVGIDDTPTIALFIEPKVLYAGPEMFLNRLKILSQRLTNASTASVFYNSNGFPFNLTLASSRSTVDFRLASIQQGKRLPAKFKGTFEYTLNLERQYFAEALNGAKMIGADTVQLIRRDNHLLLTASNEGESFTYELMESKGSPFSFNYSIEHLSTVEKIMSTGKDVIGNITPRGQLMIEVDTPTISGSVFILDIKNR
jgi:hypothetical protein